MAAQRLAPRKKGSLWSELNKERCQRMERLRLMTDAGRAVLPDMPPTGFVIDGDIKKAIKADSEVWSKQPELFLSRLQKLIENTKKGVMANKVDGNYRPHYLAIQDS